MQLYTPLTWLKLTAEYPATRTNFVAGYAVHVHRNLLIEQEFKLKYVIDSGNRLRGVRLEGENYAITHCELRTA